MSALGPGPTEWGAPTGGVGPWAGDLPDDPRYDPVLLRDGDARNVVDAYRYWTREAIIADIDTRRHPLHVAIENFGHDANIGSVVRTANAFAVHTVHIVGRRRWNRRGAMVTDRYQRLCHHDSTTGLLEFAAGAGLTVVAVDNVPGAARLEQTALPRECLLLFGQEGPGITDDARAGAAVTVSIAQFGSTRSITPAWPPESRCTPGYGSTRTWTAPGRPRRADTKSHESTANRAILRLLAARASAVAPASS